MVNLNTFLTTQMKMTSFYQPLIIKCLLEGITCNKEIAKLCQVYSPQFDAENYAKKLKIYPKQVLKKHGIAELVKGKWQLNESVQVESNSLELCNAKLVEFFNK